MLGFLNVIMQAYKNSKLHSDKELIVRENTCYSKHKHHTSPRRLTLLLCASDDSDSVSFHVSSAMADLAGSTTSAELAPVSDKSGIHLPVLITGTVYDVVSSQYGQHHVLHSTRTSWSFRLL